MTKDDANWWSIYQLLPLAAGTDKYHCSQDTENRLTELCKTESDASLRSLCGKFRNEFKRDAKVSVKSLALQKRFDKAIGK